MKNTNLKNEIEYDRLSIRDLKYIIIFYSTGIGFPYLLILKINLHIYEIFGFMMIIGIFIFVPIAVITLLLNVYLRNK